MERILFGDNQFFGINHISDHKSREQSILFRKDTSILNILNIAKNAGVNTFMCTTHDRMKGINNLIRNSGKLYADYTIYPCLPYAHKYANAVTELGFSGAMKEFMPDDLLGSLFKGSRAVITRNYISLMELFVDAELKNFKGLNTPVIFLQNVIADLLLGLGMGDVIKAFDSHIRKKYKAEPGYITMNLPAMLDFLNKQGIYNPIICTSINVDGFRMSGGKSAYERILSSGKCRVIAMQIFSGGAANTSAAIKYVCSLPGIESILFGASRAYHLHETVDLIRKQDMLQVLNISSNHLESVL
ncbi:MAG: hypothetical protein RLZZ172_101 [Bacteroidota bacterium]|jgi:hypothetical protein